MYARSCGSNYEGKSASRFINSEGVGLVTSSVNLNGKISEGDGLLCYGDEKGQ